jgi:hypothetical protein
MLLKLNRFLLEPEDVDPDIVIQDSFEFGNVADILYAERLAWGFLNRSSTVVLPLMALVLYTGLLVSSIDYGAKTIRSVEIRNAPPEVVKLLKKTTEDGDLIYVILLRSFHNSEPLSQTSMTAYAQKRGGVDLTAQQIRTYITNMDKWGWISSPRARYTTEPKEYQLTEAGKWCRKCFPQRTFMYYLRNGLGLLRPKNYLGTVPVQPTKEGAPISQSPTTAMPVSSVENSEPEKLN